MKFTWTVAGESRRPHSTPEWSSGEAAGTVEVDENQADAGDALVGIIAGRLPDGTEIPLDQAIPWDLFSFERPVTITFSPVDDSAAAAAGREV